MEKRSYLLLVNGVKRLLFVNVKVNGGRSQLVTLLDRIYPAMRGAGKGAERRRTEMLG